VRSTPGLESDGRYRPIANRICVSAKWTSAEEIGSDGSWYGERLIENLVTARVVGATSTLLAL
jgi:hypothetical protein